MATQSKRLRVLAEIYATIPDVECQGLCHLSCAAIPVMDIELANMRAAGKVEDLPFIDIETPNGEKVLGVGGMKDPSCPFLVLKRCTIHHARPMICRVFGVAAGLECPHGCKPTKSITGKDVTVLQDKIGKL